MSFYFSTGTLYGMGILNPQILVPLTHNLRYTDLVPLTHNLCYTDAYIPANVVAPDPYINTNTS